MTKHKNFRLLVSLMLAILMVFNLTTTAFGTENGDGLSLEDAKAYDLYMANGEAFVNVGDREVSAFLNVDKRFFDVEDVTMTLEIRQYNNEGYTVVGTSEYDYTALQALKEKADAQTETAYTFKDVKIPVAEGKSFNEGWAEYCVVKFNRPAWVDEEGNPEYKWAYTGDATVLGEAVKEPAPIVWLYNLEAKSYRGALIRSILSDLDIPAGTVNNENLNQNIGYLVEWEGYEPVENPYSDETFDVEYILMGNLTEVQLDDFIDAMQENNIRVNLKSIPTAWTAGKTFAELFDIMAEEDETLKTAIALDEMIYEAEALDEATYGNSPYWNEFRQTLEDAITALSTDAEESGEGAALYIHAREALLDVYLKVTGKTVLAGDLELLLEALGDGNYKVSARLNGEQTDAAFDYSWKPGGSTDASIVVAGEDLYKVNLEIKGKGSYYGEMSARLNVPEAPRIETEAVENGIAVKLPAYDKVLNTPDVLGYVAELYLNDELVSTKETDTAQTLTFDGLIAETEYVVKVYAYNVVGRSDIVEMNAAAGADIVDEEQRGDDEETQVPEDNEDVAEPEQPAEPEEPAEPQQPAESQQSESSQQNEGKDTDTAEPVNTGDGTNLSMWILLLAAAVAAAGRMAIKRY